MQCSINGVTWRAKSMKLDPRYIRAIELARGGMLSVLTLKVEGCFSSDVGARKRIQRLRECGIIERINKAATGVRPPGRPMPVYGLKEGWERRVEVDDE